MMRGEEMTARSEFAPIAEGNLSIERTLLRGVVLRLAGERKSYLMPDARIAIDNRATSTLAIERGDLTAKLAVAWGVTELRAINEREYIATGGVTAEAGYALSKYVDTRVRSEVGRSIYVPDSAGEPRWASETLIMLAVHTK